MWPSQPVANQTSYAENCLQSTVQSNESGKVFDFYSVVKNKNIYIFLCCFRRKTSTANPFLCAADIS